MADRRIETFAADFASDRQGTIAVLFALMCVALLTITGVAIDFGRILHTQQRLVAAADAAALAAGRALLDGRLTDSEVEALALEYFNANSNNGTTDFGTIATPDIQLDRSTGAVVIEVAATVPVTLMKLGGFDDVRVPVLAATKFDQRDVELSMALDVTGSMDRPGKMDALKDATKDLVDILLPDSGTPNKVRIALAPYSSGVNAGVYATAATGQAAEICTYEREGTETTDDRAPGFGSFLKVRGDDGVSNSATCPTASPVVPLSSDKDMLKRTVDTYRPAGATAGHLGAQWAWYMLSPNWSGVFGGASAPAPYYDGKTVKAMVLMTDGLFNTLGGRNFGDSSTQARTSQQMAVDLCAGMRSQSIMVFTVGFKLDEITNTTNRDAAAQTLRDCAGDSSRYFDARDGDELRAAFAQIAMQLNNLRLTN